MRASVLTVAAATSLVLACSGSGSTNTTSSGSGSGVTLNNEGCSLTFSGSYTFTYTQMSGDCGMVPAVHETINGMAQASSQNLSSACPGGSGTDVAQPQSGGGCSVTATLTGCQPSGSSDTFDVSEQVVWNAGYTSATGSFSINVMGSAACSGTYSVTVTQP